MCIRDRLFVLVATASLFVAARRDVALAEWRVVIIEPALFYFLLRAIRPSERELWVMLDAWVLGGVAVAGYGLWQYATGQDLITAEGGLLRLRSIYGSPNNVALYLDPVSYTHLDVYKRQQQGSVVVGVDRPAPPMAGQVWFVPDDVGVYLVAIATSERPGPGGKGGRVGRGKGRLRIAVE